ncbi:Ger(x)C family spore germination protein [Aneurinibacillus aneurinilyticus]|uniref:Ger(x)C family spore germination protein n=1 Tax=Aneurinibacillus aneurinilyticus TaxID=1391 RepID=UPI0023F8C1FF|nr:Ger(x)C family spore germination protein [Aneurinibacillus aneurinilyticus]MCI1695701.1 Ger(x)C family spore germination protein [Aneurinibacillus aneurinilyticus]
MIKRMMLLVSCLLLIITSGCSSDRLDLERMTLSLAYGWDIDKDDKLTVYQASTIFNKDVKKKYEVLAAKVNTPRQAREVFNSTSNGMIAVGKMQVILIGEKLLKKEGIMSQLDVVYRDPKNTGNIRMVAVKGPVSSIMESNFVDKPALPLYLTQLLDVEKRYNGTISTTLQKLHTHMFDKGITPAISEMKKDKKGLVVTGSALLDNKGMYKMSLSRRESSLLLLLRQEAKIPVVFTIRMPSLPFKRPNKLQNVKGHDFITLNITESKRNIKTRYKNNRFVFDIKMNLNVTLAERTFDMNMGKEKDRLSAIIAEQFKKEVTAFVEKVKKEKLDPFKFGWYARAHQYEHWKKNKDRWPDEFAKATVNITPNIKISSYGVIE